MNELENVEKRGLENISVVQAARLVAGIKVVKVEMEEVVRFEGCLG